MGGTHIAGHCTEKHANPSDPSSFTKIGIRWHASGKTSLLRWQRKPMQFLCACIIYNLLFLKTSVSLYISLAADSRLKSQQRWAVHMSYQQLQIRLEKLWLCCQQLEIQTASAAQTPWINWCCHNLSSALLPWYCPYGLWYCQMSLSGVTPCIYHSFVIDEGTPEVIVLHI